MSDAASQRAPRDESSARWELVASVDDLADGEMLGVETMRGVAICLVNHHGAIRAIANNCTHQDFLMSDGFVLPRDTRCVVECAWHGAQFDCDTGAVLKGPADVPIATYAVKIDGDAIYIAAGSA